MASMFRHRINISRVVSDSHLLFLGGGEISNGIGKTIRSVLRGAVVRGLAVGAGVVVGVFGVGVGSALGAQGHEFEESFGSEGTGAGELLDPGGVAVDQSIRNVFVADTGIRVLTM
jgi:hypothetical protein